MTATRPDLPLAIQPVRVVLTGFMGAGKSSVGAQLAAELGWTFIDLDDEIVRAEGTSISSLFASIGEPAFRELERAALALTLQRSKIVLALGGGVQESPACRELLAQNPATLVLYLEAPLETLLARCDQQQRTQPESARRPVLEDRAAVAERFLKRKPFYEQAHWRIDTFQGRSEEIAHEIAVRFRASTKNEKI